MKNCQLVKNLWKIDFDFVQHSLHTGPYRMKKKQQKLKVPHSISKEEDVSPIKSGKNGKVFITVAAKPGAKVSEITEVSESSIGISISAPPPVDGEANAQLLKFLSQVLGVKKSDLCLESGSRSRSKVVSVSGVSAAEVETILKESATK